MKTMTNENLQETYQLIILRISLQTYLDDNDKCEYGMKRTLHE